MDLVGRKGALWMELMRLVLVRLLVASVTEEAELFMGANPRSDPSKVFDVDRGDRWDVFRLWNAVVARVVILFDLRFDERAESVGPVESEVFDALFSALGSWTVCVAFFTLVGDRGPSEIAGINSPTFSIASSNASIASTESSIRVVICVADRVIIWSSIISFFSL